MNNRPPTKLFCAAIRNLDVAAEQCHWQYEHFYLDLETGQPLPDTMEFRLVKIGLMHTELSEMFEGVRKATMDEHCPEFTSEEVELADLIIRALDYAGRRKLRLSDAVIAKSIYNHKRVDHTNAARLADGGKKV